MAATIEKGYLLLADISGFTAFMEQTEIVHSASILHSLIELIMRRLSDVLHIAEVEGDAVFAFAPASRITRGELLVELIESTYADFRDRQQTMQHNAGCPCRACRAIDTLDLKFVTHYGDYILQKMTGTRKPVGSSVNLVHHLLKNDFHAKTGWRGYALFTELSLDQMNIQPEGIQKLEVPHDSGVVRTAGIDLNERYTMLVKDRSVFLSQENADVSVACDMDAPPPVVWDWLTDPGKRRLWVPHSNLSVTRKPFGRTGPSTRYHCATSDVIEEILDWHPFDYYTVQVIKKPIKIMITSQLKAVQGSTHVRWNMKLCGPLPRIIGRPITRFLAARKLQVEDNFKRLARLTAASDAEFQKEAATAVVGQ